MSAVEFALVAPLLFMLVFAILAFGVAFLQVQTVRAAVREGGRAAAVGGTESDVETKASQAAAGTITDASQISVSGGNGAPRPCDQQGSAGDDVTVTAPPASYGGGIEINIPFIPPVTLTPTITATFRCEV